jgi:hypothetical protein
MNTGTAALKSIATGIEVSYNGQALGVIKDGDNLVKRAERVLRSAKVFRFGGYSIREGVLVADAAQVA